MCEVQVFFKQHHSTEKNVLVPISPLHEDQPAPQHHSDIWVDLSLNPVSCIAMSKMGLTFNFPRWIWVLRKENYFSHHKHSKVKAAMPVFPHLFVLFVSFCFHIYFKNLCHFFAACSFPKSKSFRVFIPLQIQIILFPSNYLFCIQLHS